MSTYGLDEVIHRWDVGKLTVEQAIGQILLLIRERDERLQELEGRVHLVRQTTSGDGERRTGQAPGISGSQ